MDFHEYIEIDSLPPDGENHVYTCMRSISQESIIGKDTLKQNFRAPPSPRLNGHSLYPSVGHSNTIRQKTLKRGACFWKLYALCVLSQKQGIAKELRHCAKAITLYMHHGFSSLPNIKIQVKFQQFSNLFLYHVVLLITPQIQIFF